MGSQSYTKNQIRIRSYIRGLMMAPCSWNMLPWWNVCILTIIKWCVRLNYSRIYYYIFLLYLAMLSLSVKLQSSFAFRRNLVPRPSTKSENPRIDRPHPKKLVFLVFFLPLQTHCNGACSPHSLAPWTYRAVWLNT